MSQSVKKVTPLSNTTSTLAPLNPFEGGSFREAYDATAALRATVAADKVLDTNLDLKSAIHIARQAEPRIRALMTEIAKLPVPLDLIEALDLRARAAIHAQVLYTASIAPPGRLQAVYEEVLKRRAKVRSDITNLMNHGILPPNSLDNMSTDTGYRNVAYAGMYGVTTLRTHAAAIAGRGVTTAADLDELELLCNELEDLNTRRDTTNGADPEIEDQRNRAFTLMHESYEWARCAVYFIRWFQGDAQDIAPNLFTTRKPSKPREGAASSTDGANAAETQETEVLTPVATPAHAAAEVASGVRGSDPFGQR